MQALFSCIPSPRFYGENFLMPKAKDEDEVLNQMNHISHKGRFVTSSFNTINKRLTRH